MIWNRPTASTRILSAALALLACAGCSTILSFFSGDKGWMLFDVSRLRDYYYNPAGIERPSPSTVRVRVATVAKGEEGRNWEVNERMKRGLPFGGYEDYLSSEDAYVIDCAERKYQLLSSTDYNSAGKTLATHEQSDPEWQEIPSGSVLETLLGFDSVCPVGTRSNPS